ncbi:DUF4340 domain-containing protein [candidate division GN15 bacterium]|nr:DUF4340 domain-containing protein [candidate division GN15 bacterium]
MTENRTTITFVGVAVVLAALAWILAPRQITPEAFVDQGEEFYPDFTNPNTATTLEVIDYDEATASADPFKVTFKNNQWTIPSHHDYPADAKDRLAQTAAGIIDIKKDEFRSNNVAEHEAFGVIDPLDETAGLTGRGQRVTIRDASDQILADFIFGKEVEGRQGYRYVRVPGQNRVYASKVDLEITTRFEDWIKTDLLEAPKHRMRRLVLNDYSVDERTGSINRRDRMELAKQGEEWQLRGSGKLDTLVLDTVLSTLADLKIVGVRPKPEGLSSGLKKAGNRQKISQSDVVDLQSKGFYFSRDGQLLSNEGELQVTTKNGVRYTLRFGEVVYGSGEAVTAGTGAGGEQQGAAENRYVFITAEFDPSMLPEPEPPTDKSFLDKPDSLWSEQDRENRLKQDAYAKWQRDMESGREKADELNERFADWYYVISSESYDELHRSRSEVTM